MVSNSSKVGTCITGEKLRGYARKIYSFHNKKPIFMMNKNSIKLDSHGGAMSTCYIDKKLRLLDSKNDVYNENHNKVSLFIENQYRGKISIFDEKNDYIKGSLIICEGEKYNKSKKKVSRYSKSHSAGTVIISGKCAVAYVDRTYTPTKKYSLKN